MSTSLCSAVTYSTGLGEHRERVRERRYILYHFLFCQAMSFWPCSWYASTLLSILLPGAFICESVSLSVCLSFLLIRFLSVCLRLALDSTCFSLYLPVSLRLHTVCSWQYKVHTAGRGGYICFFSFQASRQMPPLPLHPFLTTWSRGSVFCCFWTALSKSLSLALSVFPTRLTKTQTPFFQPEVLVLALWAALCNPNPNVLAHTHTRAYANHTSSPSLKHQISNFSSRSMEERDGKKEIQHIYENKLDWCFDKCSLDCGYIPTGKVRSR